METGFENDPAQEGFGADSGFFVLADTVGQFPLGQLFAGGVYNERVMEVKRAVVGTPRDLADGFGKGDLAGGGVSDIFTADDVGDFLVQIVYADRELVCPAAFSVLNGKIPALLGWVFRKIPEAVVCPVNYFVYNLETEVVRRQNAARATFFFKL